MEIRSVMTMSNSGRRELVGFRVGEQAFCIDITSVIEIRGWTPTTPLPQAPDYMKGVVNLRGLVLPIIDLAARLGLPTQEPSARHAIMVVKCGDRTVGLLVEAVSDIVELDDSARQETPDLGDGAGGSGVISGIFAVDGEMISLLDLDNVLPPTAQAA
jgi:purine-binding chemotaxis protein CheW